MTHSIQPSISIAMAIYNGARFLREQLESRIVNPMVFRELHGISENLQIAKLIFLLVGR